MGDQLTKALLIHSHIMDFLDKSILTLDDSTSLKLYFVVSYTNHRSRDKILFVTSQGYPILKEFKLGFPWINIKEHEAYIRGLKK